MKQFNLNEYLKKPDTKVVTRDGRSVRIICTNKKDEIYPVVALVQDNNSNCEKTHHYTIGGKWIMEDDNSEDLFFALKKCEGWVNVYKSAESYYLGGINPYPSKSEAISHIMKNDDYVRTVKIEWEE